MRIAFFCKRRYMGKDVILDKYARLYEIPFQLASLGHEIECFCLDYQAPRINVAENQDTVAIRWTHDSPPGTLHWQSKHLGRASAPLTLLTYPRQLLRQMREFKPDVIMGASDIPHVALAAWLAQRLDVPYVIDLYDNFEGFGQARIPGFVPALRKATRSANLVLTTSEPLRQLVMGPYQAQGTVISMPSSVDKSVFCPGDQTLARKRLGLPSGATLIGTAGGLYRDKGIEPLYAAWEQLSQDFPDMHLVLAGPFQPQLPPPISDRVHYLGHLGHAQVADLFRSLDIGVISILDTTFGKYCFPQKAYEMLACGLRVAVADIGEMSEIFHTTPSLLFEAGNAQALASAVKAQITQPIDSQIEIHDWRALISAVEPLIAQLAPHLAPSTGRARS